MPHIYDHMQPHRLHHHSCFDYYTDMKNCMDLHSDTYMWDRACLREADTHNAHVAHVAHVAHNTPVAHALHNAHVVHIDH
jgi:hypothetical protein